MAERDSLDKVVGTYFAMVTAETFTFRGKTYHPKALRVSPGIFRGFTCPAGCAGCCPRFSLDYLPTERRPQFDLGHITREVELNGKTFTIVSDMQKDHDSVKCRNVNWDDGRCGIHGLQPFSCDFEVLRFLEMSDPDRPNGLTSKLFGRGWAMMRVDGERGALCEMTEADEASLRDNLRKLKRLREWVEYFELSHRLNPIIEWVATGPHQQPLIVKA
ncbi:MAG TPA: hypothetical protein VIG24_16960 [Acidimicrobiia bacterium]